MRIEGGPEKKRKKNGLERWGMGPLSGEGHVFPAFRMVPCHADAPP